MSVSTHNNQSAHPQRAQTAGHSDHEASLLSSRELLTQLVGFNTVSRESNLSLIAYIEAYLARYQVPTWRVSNQQGDKADLIARIGPDVEGGVVLSGHTDVVPVVGQPWQTDPFTLTERDGRLYGRGSCDMKGFIACALAALPQWCNQPLQQPIFLAFSYDEEIGCLGAPGMIERLMADCPRPRVAIVGEPTLMAPVVQQKGITTLRTVVKGIEAHSSQVNQGISAIHVAARLIHKIEAIMAELQAEGCCNSAFNVPHSSLHVGTIQGGTAINIMARHCEFEWEIRHLPEDGFEAVYERFTHFTEGLIQEYQQRFGESVSEAFSITTTPLVSTVPALEHRDNAQAIALCEQLLGAQDHQAVAYATEAGQFQNAGLDTVICGPGSIAQAHQPDEYIELDQLHQGDRFMARLGDYLSGEALTASE